MFVGLDVDKNYVQAAVVDGEGMLLKEQRIPNDVREIERFFAGIADAKIVIASSGPLVRAHTNRPFLVTRSARLALLLELFLFPNVVGGGCGRCLSNYGECDYEMQNVDRPMNCSIREHIQGNTQDSIQCRHARNGFRYSLHAIRRGSLCKATIVRDCQD